MRFTRLKLNNYVGIYNGMGLTEIEIDFTKCIHDTIVIKGTNGSGKSTILNALSVLPDGNDSFIPNKPAKKEVDIMSNGTLYLLSFIHDVRSTGTRITTKAYMKKRDMNGVEIEMNPNGNVTSFRDLIYGEFSLDPNFMSLSQLGSEDRGIVDKTPAERKGFVSSVVDNIEVYNDMHKTLSKRISNLNVVRNRLIGKIDQIGNRVEIEPRLKSLDNRINEMMNKKDGVIEKLASEKSIVKLLDPDDRIQDQFIFYSQKNRKAEEEIKNHTSRLYTILRDAKMNTALDMIRKNLSKLYLSSKDELSKYENELDKLNNENMYNLKIREDLSKENVSDEMKIQTLKGDIQLSNLEDNIKSGEESKHKLETLFKEIGFVDKVTLTKDEYLLGINTLMEISEIIDHIKSNQSQYIIDSAINNYIRKGINPDIEKFDFMIEECKNSIKTIESSIEVQRKLQELREKLNRRPSACTIDECGFISDAIGVEDLEYDKIIDEMYNNINNLKEKIKDIENDKETTIEINKFIYDINKVLRLVSSNRGIINRLPDMENILDKDQMLHRIETGYDFGEIDKLYSYVEYCDAFTEYQIISNSLEKLYARIEGHEEKIKSIESLENSINIRKDKLEEISSKISENRNLASEYNNKIKEYDIISNAYSECISINDLLDRAEEQLISSGNNMSKLQSDMDRITESIKSVKEYEEELKVIQNQISPLIQDRDQILHDLKVLDEYEEELEYISGNYEITEMVRYHCTPTTGIQLIYIEAYMNKTLSLTNELLKYVFNGEFELQPYVINDREFRIPINAEGLPRDDISSLSNSQKSIISMIVSFVLLEQSSSKYNILKLDEIDSPLDETNRIRFTFLLNTLMELLDVGQCIMISHNHELDLSNCDLIVLKTEPGQTFNGNIIYKY